MKKKHPIEALIEQGEHQQLDFKFEVSDSKKIARTISAFSNTDGGRLLIGVKDNGVIRGIQSDEEFYMVDAAAKMYTRPAVALQTKTWNIHGKSVLEVLISPGDQKPYLAPDKNDEYKAYIRVEDENILANAVLINAWKKRNATDGVLLKVSLPVKRLLDYLAENDYVYAGQLSRIMHINYHTACRILSDLIAIGTVRYTVVSKRIVYRKAN